MYIECKTCNIGRAETRFGHWKIKRTCLMELVLLLSYVMKEELNEVQELFHGP